MKKLVELFTFFVTAVIINAQTLTVFDIDASKFPIVKAKVFAFDENGNQVWDLSKYNVSLTENGVERAGVKLKCPVPKLIQPLSSILTLDVSGSMCGNTIEIMKAAATAWIKLLPLGKSECAITAFRSDNYFISDFTQDRAELIKSIENLTCDDGTDYNAALINKAAGALRVADNGKFKRVVVLLTDGFADGNKDEIIQKAKDIKATVYCVTVDNPTPELLKDIALKTGGKYFDNVSTPGQAEDIYRSILMLAQGGDPCEIEWVSGVRCSAEMTNVKIKINELNTISNTSYFSPDTNIAKLEFSSSVIKFRNVIPGMKKDTIVKVKALNADFYVTNILSSNSAYKISPTRFNLINGQSIELSLSFNPQDSGYSLSKLFFESEPCSEILYVSGGFVGKKPKVQTLKLTFPNGEEELISGSDTTITWDGVAESDIVQLEYSNDNGASWKNITNNAKGLKYVWKNLPKSGENKLKVRVKHLFGMGSDDATDLLQLSLLAPEGHRNIIWNPDGSRFATVCTGWDTTIAVWDATDGKLLFGIENDNEYFGNWIPDGTYFSTRGKDNGLANIRDAFTGEIVFKLSGHKRNQSVYNCIWSPDGKWIATGGEDGLIIIWDANNGAKIYTLPIARDNLGLIWSPDGTKIAAWYNSPEVVIWEVTTETKLHTLKCHKDWTEFVDIVKWDSNGSSLITYCYPNVDFWDVSRGIKNQSYQQFKGFFLSPDGSRYATDIANVTDISFDNIKIRDATNGNLLNELKGQIEKVTEVSWSPDGSRIATCTDNAWGNGPIYIYDVKTGEILNKLLNIDVRVEKLSWSPEGDRIAVIGFDYDVKIWYIGYYNVGLQEDESDQFFSIINPSSVAVDVDFGKVLKYNVKDSVFAGYIQNTGKPAIRIDNIEIKGKDAGEFAILTNVFPNTIQSGNSKNIEFRFKPKSTGIKTAKVFIATQTDTLTYNISGECVEPKIEVITEIIDFGKTPIFSQSNKTIESAIKNIGSGSLKINSIEIADKDESQFSIIEAIKSFELRSGENKSVKVRFNPDKVGRTSGKLIINYKNATEPAVIPLFGEGLPVYASIKGTVKDVAGIALEAEIGWELMSENFKNVELGKAQSSGTNGSYEFKVPIGANYAYYFKKQGYSGASDNAFLKDKKKEITITKDIVLKKPWDGSITVNNIFFEYNKSDLKPESFTELDRLVELLTEYPEAKVEISGHTDNIGNDIYNQTLSQDRAGSVVNYLIRKDMKKENLIAKGYGKTKPVADNSTDEGRAMNRRVEFKFLK